METVDELGAFLAEIEAGVRARGLVVYAGTPYFPTQSLVAAWPGDWARFLDLASGAGAKIVYLEGVTFTFNDDVRETARLADMKSTMR